MYKCSGISDKGPSEMGTTSHLFQPHANTLAPSKIGTTYKGQNPPPKGEKVSLVQWFPCNYIYTRGRSRGSSWPWWSDLLLNQFRLGLLYEHR